MNQTIKYCATIYSDPYPLLLKLNVYVCFIQNINSYMCMCIFTPLKIMDQKSIFFCLYEDKMFTNFETYTLNVGKTTRILGIIHLLLFMSYFCLLLKITSYHYFL